MNIALLTTEYAHEKTPKAGGIGTFNSVLAKGLQEKGHTVYVVVFYGKKNFTIDDDGISVFVRKSFFRKHKISELIRSVSKTREKLFKFYQKVYSDEREYISKEFYKIISDKKIDIIETQDCGGISYSLNEDIPVVIRCHGTNEVLSKEFNYIRPELYNKVLKELEGKTISKEKNNIVAVSKYAGDLIFKYFNRKGAKVIYNGVDVNKFKPSVKDKTIPKSIFYFGTLSEKKGLKFLCEVFNELNERDDETTLHIIGKGEKYFSYLEKNILTKKALKNVVYYGVMNHDDLNKELVKAKTIVFPTQGENFPFVFLEAMSLEKVIISNAIEPAYEIIDQGKNGFIAKGKDEFISTIEKVISPDFDGKLIESNARKTVENKFTNLIMVDDSVKLYKEILSKNI